jgi:predicted GTPase
VLPAIGYSAEQVSDLEATIEAAEADVVLAGTPFDLGRLLDVDVPVVRVRYEVREREGSPTFAELLDRHAGDLGLD